MGRKDNEEDSPIADTALKSLAGAGAGAIGGIIGLVVAGPMGAVAGGVAGSAIAPIVEKLALTSRRLLTQRENERVLTVLESAMLRVEQNQRASLELRVDGFLDTDESGRSSAEEICEAVIRAAQREYEEKKIFFQGNLLGNIPFHPEVDSSQANLLVRLASELSYQQYCLLSLLMRPKEFDYVFNDSLSDDERETWNRLDAGEQAYSREQNTKQHQQELDSLSALMGTHHAIRQEVFGLYSLALIGTRNESGEGKLVTATQITYKYVYLSNFGRIFYGLAQLGDIDRNDLEKLAATMRMHPLRSN